MDGPLEEQNLDNRNLLHNKVYREGPESGVNAWPCTNIVISNANRSILKNKMESVSDRNISIMGDNIFHKTWANEFELNRIECADQGGQCYMKDYPCETAQGTPIPLKYIESGLQELTIGSLSEQGCRRAVYPCSPPEDGVESDCTILKLDDGYLIEEQSVDSDSTKGGTCKQVEWFNDQWYESSEGEYKCIPKTLINNDTIDNSDTLEGAQVADWVATAPAGGDITSQCMHVGRFPNIVQEGEPVGNQDEVIFRWYAEPNGGYSLCTSSDLLCSELDPPKDLLTGLHTYLPNLPGSFETNCCYDTSLIETTGSIQLTSADEFLLPSEFPDS